MIQLNDHQKHRLALANNFFDTSGPIIAQRLTLDSVINESYAIGTIEGSVPESALFDFHFDMIFTPGALTDYYKSMSTGHNQILEAARRAFPDSPQITESIETFKSYMRSLINEAAVAMAEPMAAMGGSIETAIAGGGYSPNTSSGVWGTLRKLLSALTEGGSVIGIIHFILDIVGVVGDFIIPGVGVAADIINGIIYLIRGEWLLAAISIIAAVVIGGGDMLKLGKGVAKTSNPIFVKLAKGQTADAAQAAAKLGPAKAGPVMKFLKTVAGFIGGAVAKAITILGSFISGIAKVTKWIPGLNILLKPILEGMATALTKFGTRMSDFCAGLKVLDTTITKETLEKLEKGMASGNTYKLSDDGKILYAFDDTGRKVGAISSEKLHKSGFAEIRYGKDSTNVSKLFTTPAEFAKYQKGVARLADNSSFGKRFSAYFKNTFPKAVKRLPAALSFFIGEQIYKLMTGKEWSEGNGWPKAEVEGHGSAALNNWINDRIAKEKGDATYLPSIMLDSSDKEVYNKITDYQNNYAKSLGQPSIVPVVYDKFKNEETMRKFDAFWEQVEKGEVKRDSKGDKVDHSISDDLKKEQEKSLESPEEEKTYYSQRSSSAPEEKKSFFSKVKSFMDFKK